MQGAERRSDSPGVTQRDDGRALPLDQTGSAVPPRIRGSSERGGRTGRLRVPRLGPAAGRPSLSAEPAYKVPETPHPTALGRRRPGLSKEAGSPVWMKTSQRGSRRWRERDARGGCARMPGRKPDGPHLLRDEGAGEGDRRPEEDTTAEDHLPVETVAQVAEDGGGHHEAADEHCAGGESVMGAGSPAAPGAVRPARAQVPPPPGPSPGSSGQPSAGARGRGASPGRPTSARPGPRGGLSCSPPHFTAGPACPGGEPLGDSSNSEDQCVEHFTRQEPCQELTPWHRGHAPTPPHLAEVGGGDWPKAPLAAKVPWRFNPLTPEPPFLVPLTLLSLLYLGKRVTEGRDLPKVTRHIREELGPEPQVSHPHSQQTLHRHLQTPSLFLHLFVHSAKQTKIPALLGRRNQ